MTRSYSKRTQGTQTGDFAPARRIGAQIAGGTLGYIVGDVPGATLGFQIGGKIADAVEAATSTETGQPLPKKMTATFQGVVNPLGKTHKKLMHACRSNGWHATNESFGAVADPNAVYMHHSTYHLQLYVNAILGGMVRKLFKMAKQSVNEVRDYLVGNDTNNSVGIKLQFYRMNPVSLTNSAFELVLATNVSLENIVEGWNDVRTYLANFINDADDLEPYKLVLFYLDIIPEPVTGAANEWRHASTLYLKNEHITLHCYSQLTFQNRTKGANTTTTDQDVIDAQPLIMRCYSFKHADIRQRAPNYMYGTTVPYLLEGVPQAGVKLIRAEQFGNIGAGWQNRPDKKIFANCANAYDAVIQPGVMLNSAVSHTFSGMFGNVIKQFRVEFLSGVIATGVRGKSQLFCFEENMRTNSDNLVTVAYEKSAEVGCYFTSKPTVPMITQFTVDAENNNLPE